jgi:hypothetical protein
LFPTHPAIVAGLAGLPFGLLTFVVYGIARLSLSASSPWEPVAAAVLGITGATILSEVGTTYNDILIADVLLLGVWAALIQWEKLPVGAALAGVSVGTVWSDV